MNRIFYLSCLVALLAFSPSILASGVFQCTGAGGETTFSFVPCAATAQETHNAAESEEPSVPRQERLAEIDFAIASLEEDLDNTKRDYEISLLQTSGTARNDLTARFDESTSILIVELNELLTEREELASL